MNESFLHRPVDPSMYINRFANKLPLGGEQDRAAVAVTALRLLRSMKGNWIQTGRRPSGLCGAALYIAGHMHGTFLPPNHIDEKIDHLRQGA